MSDLAIDRFRSRPLRADLEAQATEIAGQLGTPGLALLLGYLSASVAVALERPRWQSRDRLAVDLRVVQLLKSRVKPTLPTP